MSYDIGLYFIVAFFGLWILIALGSVFVSLSQMIFKRQKHSLKK